MKNRILKLFSHIILVFILVFPQIALVGCNKQTEDEQYIPSRSEKVETSFGGRSAYMFENINQKNVTVETFFVNPNEGFVNNPNIGQAVMLNDAIRYKQEYPDREVYATITSFHYSVVAAVCLDETSDNYLKTKSLYEEDFDGEGYVRIAYLPIKAAKCGINIIVIGQIDASPVKIDDSVWKDDYSFENYYTEYLDEDTDIPGKKISDFMTFKVAKWTSYGDKSAVDMMHLKSCTVSNYRDYKGYDHGSAIWIGSVNIDGIDYLGNNGNNNTQTAVVITEHDDLRRVLYNYTKLLSQHCEQEEINEFRNIVNLKNKEQIDLLESGNGNMINSDEQIVYLGTKYDPLFELYLTPLGDSLNEWDTKYNPYSKYISKLHPDISGNNDITFSWSIAKFKDDSAFSKTLLDLLLKAFKDNKSDGNRLFLNLPCPEEEDRVDYSIFDDLVVGENIEFKKLGVGYGVHAKDIQLSYVENETRQYVSILNTLNFHQGSAYYQANSFLIIKENDLVGNNIYVDFGIFTSEGAITEGNRIINK